MAPPLAGAALDNELGLLVTLLTDETHCEGVAGAAQGVVLEPTGVEPGVVAATALANRAPGIRNIR